ncbi:Copia protein, partial [Bienertia sinuspersici]
MLRRNNRTRSSGSNRMIRQIAKSTQALSDAMEKLATTQATAATATPATPPPDNASSKTAAISKAIDQKKPPTFDGQGDPVKMENWIREFDKIFSSLKVPDHMKVDSAAYFLVEDADLWWTHNKFDLTTKVNFDEEGEEKMEEKECGWTEFKKAIRDEFFLAHMRKRKSQEFNDLEQGDMNVHEFYVKFQELARFAKGLVSDEQERAVKFEEKLNPELHSRMGAGEYTTVKEAYIRTCNAERIDVKVPLIETEISGTVIERICYCKRCNVNHPGKDCDGNLVDCNHCGKKGHRAYECFTNPRSKNFRPELSSRNGAQPDKRPQNTSNHSTSFTPRNATSTCDGGTANATHVRNGDVRRDTGKVHVMNQNEAKAKGNVVTGTFSIHSMLAYVLFDSGASHSFVCESFVKKLHLENSRTCETDISMP